LSELYGIVTQRNVLFIVTIARASNRKDIYFNISAKESLRYYELKKHKPWFDEGCSKLSDQRKQDKLQWSQDPSKINGDNLNNIRSETSRHFRNKEAISERTLETCIEE
jgi:hypothetical protein